jgi:hypothetical protein
VPKAAFFPRKISNLKYSISNAISCALQRPNEKAAGFPPHHPVIDRHDPNYQLLILTNVATTLPTSIQYNAPPDPYRFILSRFFRLHPCRFRRDPKYDYREAPPPPDASEGIVEAEGSIAAELVAEPEKPNLQVRSFCGWPIMANEH